MALCRTCVSEGMAATLAYTSLARDGETVPRGYFECSVCGELTPDAALHRSRAEPSAPRACTTCLHESYAALTQMLELANRRRAHYPRGADPLVLPLLGAHFSGLEPDELVTSSRTFARYLRPDLQRALDGLWRGSQTRCVGLHRESGFATLTYASLLQSGHQAVMVTPLQYEDVDIGEVEPVRCMATALWLVTESDLPCAVLLTRAVDHGQAKGWHVEIAVPRGPGGESVSRQLLHDIEDAVQASASYRGKVISLECNTEHRGMVTGSTVVHRLVAVDRDEIILPQRTLDLIDRNVFDFVHHRDRLVELGMPMKKGLLFYGAPGTGKTHTIRYIAGGLPEHTTLLITAGQVAALAEYMALARLLSPAIVVVEDVDLIARDREEFVHPGQEALLNRLLNEMDGLRENCDVLFILTTNRPEALEEALAGRPGRIDQAIEFPLPDDKGRSRLIDLYRHGLDVPEPARARIVDRTAGVSASFIKELMRRIAQFTLDRAADSLANEADIDRALAEMLFDGGRLNAKLLGAADAE
jgi:hypothetical protein